MRSWIGLLLIGCSLLLASCASPPDDGRSAPLLRGIGPLEFAISREDRLTQAYFNQALTLAFGFNHAEAVRSFREASRRDPTCGICYWGEALALGPNINAPMSQAAVGPAWNALQKALANRASASLKERAYIDALSVRYSESGENRQAMDRAYADAMAMLVDRYPDDTTARTLYAEALMDLTPWGYWNDDGSPASEDTVRLVAELERVIDEQPDHPGALHLYIHAMERFQPHKAVAAADRLGPLVPVAGHLVHMPSHIYLRVGRYEDAVRANEIAAEADEDYIAQCNAQGLYPAAYYPHNLHFLWYAAMTDAQEGKARAAADKMVTRIPAAMAAQMGALQMYLVVPAFNDLRFGRWQRALDFNPPGDLDGLALTRALVHYARGVAHAGLGDVVAAESELGRFDALVGSGALDEIGMRREDVMDTLMGIARSTVEARIARAREDAVTELAALHTAVSLQDSLPYAEPPLWHQPMRQVLGEAQLRSGDKAAAAATFEADLAEFPANPFSLEGLLRAVGSNDPALVSQRDRAWRRSDLEPAIVW